MNKLIFVIIFLCFGCCTLKKVQTKTITETVIRIDTIIKFVPDTIPVIRYVRITDTAYIENNTAIAKSYFSTTRQRIVLELSGKKFDVPVTIFKKITQERDEKKSEPVKRYTAFDRYFIYFLLSVILFFLIKDRKNIFRK